MIDSLFWFHRRAYGIQGFNSLLNGWIVHKLYVEFCRGVIHVQQENVLQNCILHRIQMIL